MALKIRYIFGRKPTLELLQQNPSSIKIFHLKNDDHSTLQLLRRQGVKFIIHKNDHFFEQFKDNINHQNFVVELKENDQFLNIVDFEYLKKQVSLLQKRSIVLVLDEIMDVQNFGAMLRTAYAANVQAVIFKKDNQAQINDFVIKTSVGFINKIPLLPVVNLNNAISKLKELGFWIYSSYVQDNKTVDYQSVKYDVPVALVIGNENKGVSRLVAENSDFLIKIPMRDDVDSLNASVACGILLYGIALLRNIEDEKSVNILNKKVAKEKR